MNVISGLQADVRGYVSPDVAMLERGTLWHTTAPAMAILDGLAHGAAA